MLIKVQREVSVKNIIKNNLIVFGLLAFYVLFRVLYDMGYQ